MLMPTDNHNIALVQSVKSGPQEVKQVDVPALKAGEVLVKLEATGLNPVDYKIAHYGVFIQSWPTILGSDGAGVVVAAADDVSVPAIGDRVFFQAQIGNIRSSTFQRYAAVPAVLAAPLPHSLSFEQGATLGVAGITAARALFVALQLDAPWTADVVAKNAGKTVLIWGGSTSVGHLAVQLAALAGATVIVTASPQYHAKLKTLGAAHTIDYKAPDVVDQIRALTNGNLTHAFDTTGPGSQPSFDSLSKSAASTLAIINPDNVQGKDAFANRTVSSVFGSSYADVNFASLFWSFFSSKLKEGKIIPQDTRVIGGLDKIVEAQAEQIAGKVSSQKLIAIP
ncbi:hypothetical protein HDU99_003976 [Rhizoclosmatium hyalinum]|nr:hypothetical protein HDU99_003976 [Rhizoclosmatium hyalinum]